MRSKAVCETAFQGAAAFAKLLSEVNLALDPPTGRVEEPLFRSGSSNTA
jgi:hypothetical protein